MPLLLLVLFAAIGLGWFETRPECPAEVAPCDLAPIEPPRSWQAQCLDRFDAARAEASAIADFPQFARGELRTDDNPGGIGGITFRLELDGVRYGAGVSGPQPGDIPDVEWYSLNGAVAPQNRFSLWKDAGGRSGFVAAIDGHDLRRDAFRLVFQRAIDDCLELSAARRPAGCTGRRYPGRVGHS